MDSRACLAIYIPSVHVFCTRTYDMIPVIDAFIVTRCTQDGQDPGSGKWEEV